MNSSLQEKVEANRRNWNERTSIHAASKFYDVEGFKSGRITLTDIEIEEVGPVAGKSLLHLQCHFGMDTMSWARLGARATGVDIADDAIKLARELNRELALDADFIRADVYDLPSRLDKTFDIVYTALGVLCWLPNLRAWAEVVEHHLKPGGTFYILDGHPAFRTFEAFETPTGGYLLKPTYSYFSHPDGICDPGGGHTYTGSETLVSSSHEWQHSMSDIMNAIIGVGLKIEWLNEFAISGYRAFPHMRQHGDGWWRLDGDHGKVPFLFSIKATKQNLIC